MNIKSLGYFTMELPSNGMKIVTEKFEGPQGIYYKHGATVFRDGELKEIGEAPVGKLPPPATTPWNQ